MEEEAPLETRIVRRRLKDLHPPNRNARYMKATQFNRLVDNLRKDKRMTSVPLVYPAGGDVILSGNHRVQAAIKAGIEEADVIEIIGEITPGRQTALQLSHNAVVGQDDASTLGEMYGSLEFDDKLYSGVTDEMLGVEELDLASLSAGATVYHDVVLTFLPEQEQAFRELLANIGEKGGAIPRFVAPMSAFNALFEALIAVKEKLNILNTATAILALAELARERLVELEGKEPGGTPAQV